jgi:diguanylate cyclase (GGDEF)-like protein
MAPPKTLLVVDDDPEFRALIRPALEGRGLVVVEAASGQAAGEALVRAQPDLIIVDGLLPDMKGITWIERLRATGNRVPVIFVSSFWKDLHSFRRLTQELGVAVVSHKPVSAALLAQQVEQVLGTPGEPEVELVIEEEAPVDELAELRHEYRRALPEKVEALTRAVAASRLDGSRRPEARALAHRLRGTAGSFGAGDIGEMAGRIEDLLVRIGEAASEELWRRVDREILLLTQAVRAANGEPLPEAPPSATARLRGGRVLIVDDDADFARHTAALLAAEGATVTHLADPLRVLEVLDEVEPELVLLDSIMPGMNGLDVCRMMRTIPRWQDLPVIFVTVETGLEVRLAAFEAGVDDYFPKPIAGPELAARVRVRLERARLMRARMATDALTGLLLRRAFLEAGNGRLSEARRYGRPVTVALLDLDGFKGINDAHGHFTGDTVLAGVGKLLAERLRAEDLRGRWGGEEFALLFHGQDGNTIAAVVERLRRELEAMEFRGESGARFRVSFSAGLACLGEDGDKLDELLIAADRRLYAAKRAGRARTAAVG